MTPKREESLMTNPEELKPKLRKCPFCGVEAEKHIGSFKDGCFCANEECILFAKIFSIQDWNTRIGDKYD